MTLTILEHKSAYYGPRTYENAHAADVTIAIAVDYGTAGERLTHKAAGEKYLKLDPALPWIENARILFKRLARNGNNSPAYINVAGNGMYTLSKHGKTQEEMNQYVYDILAQVDEYYPIRAVRSGGQTGVDIAGGVAGVALNIPTTLLLPANFLQRPAVGVDNEHTEDEIRKQVMEGVARLKLK